MDQTTISPSDVRAAIAAGAHDTPSIAAQLHIPAGSVFLQSTITLMVGNGQLRRDRGRLDLTGV